MCERSVVVDKVEVEVVGVVAEVIDVEVGRAGVEVVVDFVVGKAGVEEVVVAVNAAVVVFEGAEDVVEVVVLSARREGELEEKSS